MNRLLENSPFLLAIAGITYLVSKGIVFWLIHKRLPTAQRVRKIAQVIALLVSPTLMTPVWVFYPDFNSELRLIFLPIFAFFFDFALIQYLNAAFEPVLPEDRVGEADVDASNAGNFFFD